MIAADRRSRSSDERDAEGVAVHYPGAAVGEGSSRPQVPRGDAMLAKVRTRVAIAGELLEFFWRVRLWWMIPMVLVLLGASALLILAHTTAIAPFIYVLF